jgi:hypothetical protein
MASEPLMPPRRPASPRAPRRLNFPLQEAIAAVTALILAALLPTTTLAMDDDASRTIRPFGGGSNGQLALWGRGVGSCLYGPVHAANTAGERSTWGMMVAGNFGSDAHSEAFLYDPVNGDAEFRRPDSTTWGLIGTTLYGLRDSWSTIVAGRFGGSATLDDLFFYDPIAAEAEFWSTDGAGNITRIGSTWSGINSRIALIVPGNFGPEAQSELLFYDPVSQELRLYSTVTRDQIGPTTGGVRTSWTKIVVGNFGGGTGFSDLFFYDAANGEAEFYRTNGLGELTMIGSTQLGLPGTLNQVFAGDFHTPCDGATNLDDLYFCSKDTGETWFLETDGNGGIYPFAAGGADPGWGLSVPGRFFPGTDWAQILGYLPGWVPAPFSNLYIVAHCDDDFLFMNPDIHHALLRRERVRVVYLTAGQNDQGPNYWRDGRERGGLMGYAKLAGAPGSSWSRVGTGTPALYRLDAYPGLELQFVRLPSGTEYGDPVNPPYPACLVSLWEGTVPTLSTVDGAMAYTRSGLVDLLSSTMLELSAARVCTLDDQDWDGVIGQAIPGENVDYGGVGGVSVYIYDHKDHCASARFAAAALMQYSPQHAPTQFLGYTSALQPSNVAGTELRWKLLSFSEYARSDMNIGTPPPFGTLYDPWISRQYTAPGLIDVPSTDLSLARASLSVFPNPLRAHGTLSLSSSEATFLRAANYSIFDVAGRVRGRGELAKAAGSRRSLPIPGLTPGVYLISIMDEAGKVLQSGRFEIVD